LNNPQKWYRIELPTNTLLWVSSDFIDAVDNTVTASQINVRSGPGASFPVVLRLNRGDKVRRIREIEGWISIKPSADASAYIVSSHVDLVK
jgi:uncharacterized protein YgiM (DUF1202 family)